MIGNPFPSKAHLNAGNTVLEEGREPIAMIGMACRFPGAPSLEAFWQLMGRGVDAITEVPPERFNVAAIYDPRPATPGKIVTRWGGFLPDVDCFDPSFFGISPREAVRMDPQQRLLLEVTWEALEDAGQLPEKLAGSQTGVFIGMITNDYEDIQFSDPASMDIYASTGGFRSVASGRLSFALGLSGPSMTIDTACSSSLVAVHLACQSLWTGSCTMAIAGGVNLILHPAHSLGFSQARMLAPDGRCKFGDSRANGFVRSDGVGVVLLKPLAMALADEDPIYAVIRGTAVNNDGNSSGFMTPSQKGQEAVLREAYQVAGVAPAQVQYVEAHGTGTAVGDPIELQALGIVLGQGRPVDSPCLVGSVKTNIGHTEGAAGIAGLIKAALCLQRGEIPASLHFQEPNPHIPWHALSLTVPKQTMAWPAGPRPAYAGVSSFGISGTNAHAVLQGAPARSPLVEKVSQPRHAGASSSYHLLPLSAHNPETLVAFVQTYQRFLAGKGGEGRESLPDVCYTAGAKRSHHDYRLAVVGQSLAQMAERLALSLEAAHQPGVVRGRRVHGAPHKIVFVFPGQGSQWLGMGRQLLAQAPVFREAMVQCEAVIRPYVDWSLLEQLAAEETHSRLNEIGVVQPVLFAIQVSLTALWQSWGIVPDAVVGHSMGEIAAAQVAGVLSLAEAAQIICCRSQLLQRVSGRGAMAAVELSLDQARQALAGYEERVSIAVSNSSTSTVLSGDPAALAEILNTLQEQAVFGRLVKVDVASHSPQMDLLRAELLQLLDGLAPRPAAIPFYSTVTNQMMKGPELDAAYWVRNLREPVLFAPAVQQLVADGHDVYLEISPHPVLLPAIQQGVHQLGQDGMALPSLRRDDQDGAVILESLGTLYSLGFPVAWQGLYPVGGCQVTLPPYPWQRDRFWLDDAPSEKQPAVAAWSTADPSQRHPFLRRHLQLAHGSGGAIWETELSTRLFPYLADHRVGGAVVFPATGYIELVRSAAAQLVGRPAGDETSRAATILEMAFQKALLVPAEEARTVQLSFSPDGVGVFSFHVYSREAGAESWLLHCQGKIRMPDGKEPSPPVERVRLAEIQARCPEELAGEPFYKAWRQQGNEWGPHFQAIEHLWCGDGEALGRLRIPKAVQPELGQYGFHPAVLDGCAQVLAAALPVRPAAGEPAFMPDQLDHVWVGGSPGSELWSYVRLRQEGHLVKADVQVFDEEGTPLAKLLGIRLQYLGQAGPGPLLQNEEEWLYQFQWQEQALVADAQASKQDDPTGSPALGRWLIFADSQGFASQLMALLAERGGETIVVTPGTSWQRVVPGRYQLEPSDAAAYGRLLQEILSSPADSLRGVIHLWSLDVGPTENGALAFLETAQRLGCESVLHLLQALSRREQTEMPRLWLGTRGVYGAVLDEGSPGVAQAPLWGMARVIANEYPELRGTVVDVSPAGTGDELAEADSLLAELGSASWEQEIALRGGTRYVHRLVRHSNGAWPADRLDQSRSPLRLVSDRPFRLTTAAPGILDNLAAEVVERPQPGPGKVLIQVAAASLNFRDVMLAMGLVPPLTDPLDLGWECAGTVVAVGEGVMGFQVDDPVIAVAPPCFGTYAVADAPLVIRKPAGFSFEEAATIPIAFLTAYYALHHLGRLNQGERVLIHAAAGGVGLAAVQVAQWLGAEIFATAGSPEKRDFLRKLGVQHTLDSRSLAFADELLALTNGQGVDVVLNSLAGEFIAKGLSVLSPYGRFLELGKADILQNTPVGLGHFRRNISFFGVDVAQAILERPAFAGRLLDEVMDLVNEGIFRPLPIQGFAMDQAIEAFHHMAHARHIGKIVLSLPEKADESKGVVPTTSQHTYLITGGVGDLGLIMARWLGERGARRLILAGRTGLPPRPQWEEAASDPASRLAQQIAAVRELEAMGVAVQVVALDVGDESQLRSLLKQIEQEGLILRGVVHAAGVVQFKPLLETTAADLRAVFRPKVIGGWLLHQLLQDVPLDFFILFSSASTLLSSPLLGSYAAANAFLDALAHHRAAQGQPALTVNWGFWAEAGMIARLHQADGRNLAPQGMYSFTPKQAVQVLERLLQQPSPQVGVMPINWREWSQAYPSASRSSLLCQLVPAAAARDRRMEVVESQTQREVVLSAGLAERRPILEQFLREQVARVLRLSPTKLDVHQPLTKLGLDSLMAVELKHRLETSLGVTIPVLALLQNISTAQLAGEALEQLQVSNGAGSLAEGWEEGEI